MQSWLEKYLTQLAASPIPLPEWGVIILWVVIFFFTNVLLRKNLKLLNDQKFVLYENLTGLVRKESLKLTLVRIGLSAAIFACASFFGGPIFAFLAGGWVVSWAASIPSQVQSHFFFLALSQPGAAKGSVTLSARLKIKEQAFQWIGRVLSASGNAVGAFSSVGRRALSYRHRFWIS